jgi:hypothetical protein
MNDNSQTSADEPEFDFSRFPLDTLFHDRRTGRDRRGPRPTGVGPADSNPDGDAGDAPQPGTERRARKKERRRRIDPTTFEKQYTDDELEFMTAMQRFKDQSGQSFPTHGEVLRVALSLGYRKVVIDLEDDECECEVEVEAGPDPAGPADSADF